MSYFIKYQAKVRAIADKRHKNLSSAKAFEYNFNQLIFNDLYARIVKSLVALFENRT
jgi:hypothetical protein